jgi:hypothetical protein
MLSSESSPSLHWFKTGTADSVPAIPSGLGLRSMSDGFYLDDMGSSAFVSSQITLSDRNWVAAAPLWLIAAILAILPAVQLLVRWRSSRRENSGLCPSCGYDLRASKDRCPECGTIMAGKATVAR